MIRFESVSKRFGNGAPAVDRLDLQVREGELTVLVGPSGCGKTTSLRMINRLEDLSEGRILVADEDVMAQNPIELRRGIGYVMQSSGLFPHRSIRDNIATVPHLLGWDRARTERRIDELVELVGLSPDLLERYPHALSGGQQQRVGVARALAADPPIMLMDEPFAAVDPIVRTHLQDEFLRLQRRLAKTIVFVTHDIDEAIKLGDRIAVFRDGGRVAQYASPTEILSAPANDFVVDFLGQDRELRRLALLSAAAAPVEPGPVARLGDSAESARASAAEHGCGWLIVLDDDDRVHGWIGTDTAEDRIAADSVRPFKYVIGPDESLRAALNGMVASDIGAVPRVDADGRYEGLLTPACLNRQLAPPRDEGIPA